MLAVLAVLSSLGHQMRFKTESNSGNLTKAKLESSNAVKKDFTFQLLAKKQDILVICSFL